MKKSQKALLLILVLIGLAYLLIFHFPNSIGSDNHQMVSVFEPDEASQLTPTLNMIERSETLKKSILRFFFYGYYFYGFPFFAFSAILLLPLRALGEMSNYPLIMTILRQVISVLPMLISILLLVFIQTKFKSSWKTLLLFVFLLAVPAVVKNNLWWHPDSISFLFVALTLFFLVRDNFKFSWNFYFAAMFCGFATGTKWTGLFFFLTIPVYIIWAWSAKKISLKKAAISALGFVGTMLLSVLASNPILIYPHIRSAYYDIFIWQSDVLSSGYEVLYDKGLSHVVGLLDQYYGQAVFYLVVIAGVIWGIVKDKRRLLNVLILTWVLPYFLYQTFFVAVKYQYLIPLMVPLLSSIANLFDLIKDFWNSKGVGKQPWRKIAASLMAFLLLIQFGIFIMRDVTIYTDSLQRVETSQSLNFFSEFEEEVLPFLPEDRRFKIYKDVRLYLPASERWNSFSNFKTLEYSYFIEHSPDLILLMQQRIYDYTSDYAVENAIDPDHMQRSYKFYTDANLEKLDGYTLIFRNDYGLVYIKDELSTEFFGD
jgi:hypothetical protein